MFYGHHRGERHGTSNGDCHRCQYRFGQLAGRVSEQESEPNAFQQGISRVSMLLIRFMLVMAPVVLLINGYTKGDWWEAALFALSVAVGLTPEMLPMIVTSTLARGAVKLSKQKVIVKHLDAIQNFGAMDILCTDKTGTLTQDKIVLENHTDISGKTSERVLHSAWLNSHYQTGLKTCLIQRCSKVRMKSQRVRWPAVGKKLMRFRLISSVVGCRWLWQKIPNIISWFAKAHCRKSSMCVASASQWRDCTAR